MGLVTTKEAAQILGVTAVRVRQLIEDGRKPKRDHARWAGHEAVEC